MTQTTDLIRCPELLHALRLQQRLDQLHDHRRTDEVRLDVQHAQRFALFDRLGQAQRIAIGQADVGQRQHLQVLVAVQRGDQLLEFLIGNGLHEQQQPQQQSVCAMNFARGTLP